MLRTGGAAAALGFLFGSLESSLWGGIYMWVVLYAVGFGAGKLLHKIASHKLGKKVIATMLGGLLAGALLSPAGPSLLGRTAGPNTDELVKSLSDSGDSNFPVHAAKKARKHFPEFAKSFETRTSDQNFLVSTPIRDGDDEETLRLNVDAIDGDEITGRVSYQPEILTNVKEGDVKTIKLNDITDFYYTDADGAEHGNYAINRAETKRVAAALYGYNSNPYRTSGSWMNLLVLAFGIISPVLAVRVRN